MYANGNPTGASPAFRVGSPAVPPNGTSYAAQGWANPSSSSSSLLQQQLAQQAAMQRASQSPAPQQPSLYAQNPQQHSLAAPSPTTNGVQQLPRVSPELASLLTGITPERFATYTPQQQAAVKAYYQAQGQQKAAQQTALGLGYPGAAPPNGAQARPPQQQPFMRALIDFHQRKGTPLTVIPVIEGLQVDLTKLFQLVAGSGGFQKVHTSRAWGPIVSQMGYPVESHSETLVISVAQTYYSIIYPFEQVQMAQHAARQAAARASTNPHPTPPLTGNAYLPQPSPQLVNSPLNRANSYVQQQPGSASPYPAQISPRSRSVLPGQQQSGMPSAQGWPSMAPPQIQAGGPEEDRKGKGKASDPSPLQAPQRLPSARRTRSDRDDSDYAPSPGGSRVDTFGQSTSTAASPLPPPVNSAYPIPPPGFVALPPNPFDIPPAQSNPDIVRQQQAQLQQHQQQQTHFALQQQKLLQRQSDSMKRARDEPTLVPPKHVSERKRSKMEHAPPTRQVSMVAGWDLTSTEEAVNRALGAKKQRSVLEMGVVDIYSLTMSLKSRLASEVAFALNMLVLISLGMRSSADDRNGMPFQLTTCGGLLDELIDLLEETAFGEDDDGPSERAAAPCAAPDSATYRQLFRTVALEEAELRADLPSPLKIAASQTGDTCLLGPSEVVLAVVNLIRNFSFNDENARLMANRPHILALMLRLAELPLQRSPGPAGQDEPRWPLEVTAADSMALKKHALQFVANLGLEVKMSVYPDPLVPASLFSLLSFFLAEAHHRDQLHFDFAGVVTSVSRLSQPQHSRLHHYLDVALSTFACVTTLDANREVFSRAVTTDHFELFQSLLFLLPITEADFGLVVQEAGLIFVQNLAMALYNLAFLAPPSLKQRLRAAPGVINGLFRVVTRLSSPEQSYFSTLCMRCVAIIRLLSDGGGVSSLRPVTEGPWLGMTMQANVDEYPNDCCPTKADVGMVKAHGHRGVVTVQEPPVLIGRDEVFEALLFCEPFGECVRMVHYKRGAEKE